MNKKIFSWILMLAMVISIMPVPAVHTHAHAEAECTHVYEAREGYPRIRADRGNLLSAYFDCVYDDCDQDIYAAVTDGNYTVEYKADENA